MKTLATVFIMLCTLQVQAESACKCNCLTTNRALCASGYDINHPCGTLCDKAPAAPPIGNLACTTTPIYNQQTGMYQWEVICFD